MMAARKYPVETLTPAEVDDLLARCSRRAPTGIRNRALILTLHRAGLRIGEALALKPSDLDPGAGTINVRRGKGARQRIVGLDDQTWTAVSRWLDVRARRGISSRALIFCTLAGKPIHQQYVRALLTRLATRAGIDKRVHPHGLRHTFAAELAREGTPVNLIQRALGHGSLATTSRYVDHVAAPDVVNAMRARHDAGTDVTAVLASLSADQLDALRRALAQV